MFRPRTAAALALAFGLGSTPAGAVCDGNPHGWPRLRRCDQYDPKCPDATWQKPAVCEGVGGIARDDGNGVQHFNATRCTPVATPDELAASGVATPQPPRWPASFVNDGFFEQQIFVKHDPFCLAQIPAMVSNGSHCYKRQQGTFNYDSTQGSLRIDYLQADTVDLPHTNETEYFYHTPDGTVHPHITRYGILPYTPACPCIKLGIGPVSPDWAHDAVYVGREKLAVEFLWADYVVDHFVKGPHHVWADVATGNIVRMYQPFNGLEVFHPEKYSNTTTQLDPATFKLPTVCALEQKLGCINGEGPTPGAVSNIVRAFHIPH